jgi:hypothetical protein
MSRKLLCIDGYCGLGGWSEGFLAEGWDCIGIDIERHEYGDHKYPCDLILADMLTIHGSQFKDADCFAMSPPCQFFSYTAMPWGRAKALAAKVRADPVLLEKELALFNACFRIQAEASLAAGRHIPMIVENVRGAQPWVGRARFNFGSFYLWGDVPALMPITRKATKVPMPPGGDSLTVGFQQMAKLQMDGCKVPGFRFDGSGKSFQSASVAETGVKCGGDWFNSSQPSISRLTGSKSPARKAASAMIAKIPFPLSRYIAATFRPREAAA